MAMATKDYSTYPPSLEEELKALDIELEEGKQLVSSSIVQTVLLKDFNFL